MAGTLAAVLAVLVGVVAAALGLGLYVSQVGDASAGDIVVTRRSEDVETAIAPFEAALGSDLEPYKRHLYRLLSYAMHMLGEEGQAHRSVIEKALVYHDIGIWTDDTLAYLEPSAARLEKDLGASLSAEELQLARDIIIFHHKVTAFEGPHADVVNAVRKADWIDVSMGVVSHGVSRDNIAKVNVALPKRGFHSALLAASLRLHGFNVFTMVRDASSIFSL